MWLYCITIAAVAVITVAFVVFANDTNYRNIEFLSDYGWVVSSAPIETEKVTLPSAPDDVYSRYNLLQRDAGLDLTPYYGKVAVRYTYVVLNYPEPTEETVRANVLCIDDIPVAGDIMTVSANGFMHSLAYLTTQDTPTDSYTLRQE